MEACLTVFYRNGDTVLLQSPHDALCRLFVHNELIGEENAQY